MTTITFDAELDIKKKNFKDVQEFLENLSETYDFSYEEYLEKKMQEAKSSPKSDFVNL